MCYKPSRTTYVDRSCLDLAFVPSTTPMCLALGYSILSYIHKRRVSSNVKHE